jgi:hypothetical protein
MRLVDLIGWTATAVFVGSYAYPASRSPAAGPDGGRRHLVGYGVLMQAPPIIVANLLSSGPQGGRPGDSLTVGRRYRPPLSAW